MGTTLTSVYGLLRTDDLTALRDLASIVTQHADTVEAALIRGGIAPPGASDIAALSGRVTTNETDISTLKTARTTNEARITKLEGPPRASLRQSTAQGVFAAGWNELALQTEDIDSHDGHSLSTNVSRWTCPAGLGGDYTVEGVVVFDTLTTGTLINARICKNGTPLPNASGAGGQYGGSSGNAATTGSKLIRLVPGDYLTLQGTASTSWATKLFPDTATSMTLWRVAL